jgi:hypothetical protein
MNLTPVHKLYSNLNDLIDYNIAEPRNGHRKKTLP